MCISRGIFYKKYIYRIKVKFVIFLSAVKRSWRDINMNQFVYFSLCSFQVPNQHHVKINSSVDRSSKEK